MNCKCSGKGVDAFDVLTAATRVRILPDLVKVVTN